MHEKLLASALFSTQGDPAKRKIILLGSADSPEGELTNWLRSLNIEHVSPSGLMRVEISRDRQGKPPAEKTVIAAMRRWFFARKPDAGFVLMGFPATLLQAQLLDEWLDARDESPDAVIPLPGAETPLIEHYRTLGLLVEGDIEVSYA